MSGEGTRITAESVLATARGVRIEHFTDGAVVWAADPRSLHHLNVAAATLLAEVDGQRSLASVADIIAAALASDPDRVREDCRRLGETLVDAGVLRVASPTGDRAGAG